MDGGEELRQAEHAWMQAVVDRDRDVLRRVLAPEFRMVSARTDQVTDREGYLAVLDAVELRAFAFEHLDVDLFGDTAVVRARYAQQASVAGQDWSDRFVFTDVWLRRGGQWQAVARHSSTPPRRAFLDPPAEPSGNRCG